VEVCPAIEGKKGRKRRTCFFSYLGELHAHIVKGLLVIVVVKGEGASRGDDHGRTQDAGGRARKSRGGAKHHGRLKNKERKDDDAIDRLTISI
jgi:hypothetical protein